MDDPARSGIAAYGEPNEPARTAATGSTVADLLLDRRPERGRYYPWLEDYLTWLEGEEAHRSHLAWLKQTPPWWERSTPVGYGVLREPDPTPPGYTFGTCVTRKQRRIRA